MTHTLLFIALAVAQNTTHQPTPPPTFAGHGNNVQSFINAHDLDKDGVLTRQEFENFRRQRFDASDFDHNGHIDLLEYVREFDERIDARLKPELEAIHGMTERRFQSLAANQTHISRARYDESGNRAFAAYSEGKLPETLPADAPRSLLDLPTNHTKGGMLALYDRNSDGKLSREEYDLAREEQFKRTDANDDGKLSRHEYEAEFNQRVQARIHDLKTRELRQTGVRFGVLDTDKNDEIGWDEYLASGMRLFQRTDRNQDGKVDSVDVALPAPARNSGG
ncbi:hypothetical protein CO614_01785 [Lysobacteraceae bacterium NML120232]|nr:hypothetical protein CO614_01785 [Xanthomonadaceae bacterium NML120232]